MRDFTELKVRDKAHKLTLDVYRVTLEFPKGERYGLVPSSRNSLRPLKHR